MKYQTLKDIIEWDVYNWSFILKVWAPIITTLPPDSKVLAVGERNGGLSLWLALLGFKVDCTDRLEPGKNATALHKRYNVSTFITYKAIDIVHDILPVNEYDLVIAKSVIGGLKEQYNSASTRSFEARSKAVNNIYNSLKPGGYFLCADNAKGSSLHQYFRNRKNKHNNWYYFTPQDITNLYKTFKFVNTTYCAVIPTVSKSRIINLLVYLINANILFLFPDKKKYIAVTTAQKQD